MKILVAGDFCPSDRIVELFDLGDFDYVFGQIKPYFDEVDFSLLNFECCIASETDKPIRKTGPNLRCNDSSVSVLNYLGVDLVCLANNHIRDYGDIAVERTIDKLEEAGLGVVGAGRQIYDASKIRYEEIEDKIVAFVNACENEFTIATETHAGASLLDPISLYYKIIEARSKADYVLVILHGGHEHCQLPSLKMRKMYRFFIDIGADAVINHHQHCFCSYEIYNDKPIFYGIGNFCFDNRFMRNEKWNYGYLVILEINKEKVNSRLIPYEQCNQQPCLKIVNNTKFKEEINRLNAIMSDKRSWVNYLEQFYSSDPLLIGFMPKFRRYCSRFAKLLLRPIDFLYWRNCVTCQSHYERIVYELEKKIR